MTLRTLSFSLWLSLWARVTTSQENIYVCRYTYSPLSLFVSFRFFFTFPCSKYCPFTSMRQVIKTIHSLFCFSSRAILLFLLAIDDGEKQIMMNERLLLYRVVH